MNYLTFGILSSFCLKGGFLSDFEGFWVRRFSLPNNLASFHGGGLIDTLYCCHRYFNNYLLLLFYISHIKSNHALLRYTACQHRTILYKVFEWKSWLSELCFIGELVPKHSTTEFKTSFLETLFSVEKVLACSMKLLREFYFAGWRFVVVCGNKFLWFKMTEISG